jgi:uroporphyrinogen-III synthase
MRLLVLRPEPGATATAARALAHGFTPIVAPLFEVRPRAWERPDAHVDAVMLTSANAARAVGDRAAELRGLPLYAVGARTAEAARTLGLAPVHVGESGVADLVGRAARDGVRTLLHLAGEDRTEFDPAGLSIVTRIVYAAEPVEPPPALPAKDAVALLHSARAARRLATLVDASGYAIAALGPAVAAAAGPGWRAVAIAGRPDDDALLAAAARLCQDVRA